MTRSFVTYDGDVVCMSLATGLLVDEGKEVTVSWSQDQLIDVRCQLGNALIILSRQYDVRIFISLTLNLAGVKTGPEWRVGGDQVRQSNKE